MVAVRSLASCFYKKINQQLLWNHQPTVDNAPIHEERKSKDLTVLVILL
jgi:hypothetical protein